MLNFRRLPALLPHIIGAGLLLVFLGGCSAVRIGYNNAPALAYWWLDSYIDFNDAQAMQVRDSLNTLQAWHRKTELPAYAELLRQMQGAAGGRGAETRRFIDDGRAPDRMTGLPLETDAEIRARLIESFNAKKE